MTTIDERLLYLPSGYSEPTNELETLKAARAVLSEEGRWCQGDEFDANVGADKDPYCGSWQACAVGAVALVTMGVELRTSFNTGRPQYWATKMYDLGTDYRWLYDHSVDYLNDATYEYMLDSDELDEDGEPLYPYTSVVDKNDDGNTTLKEMLAIFDKAINKLEGK